MATKHRRLRNRITSAEFLLAVIGTITLLVALLLAIDPALIDPAIAEQLSEIDAEIDSTAILLLVTLLFALFGLWRIAFPGSSDLEVSDETQSSVEQSVEQVIGATRTDEIEEAILALKRGEQTDLLEHRTELRKWFVDLSERCGTSREETVKLIESGEWTDDPVAAIFLGTDSVGDYSFAERVRGWLFPGSSFERRLDRFLDACEHYFIDQTGVASGNATDVIAVERQSVVGGLARSSAATGVFWLSRWQSGVIASITFVAAGFYYGLSSLFLVAIIPLGFIGYAAVSRTADPHTTLDLRREASTRNPLPGEPVTVTLSIQNNGTHPLTDVRIADQIPEGLRVIDGTDVAGFALRVGEERTIEYTLRPKRGTHNFGSLLVRIRSLSGTAVSTAEITPDGDHELSCRVPVEDVPVHQQTVGRVGSVPTSKGGPGMEFHSTREYRFGDPPRWIDWRRLARTDELGTINYRLQEATTVVIVIDGRERSRVVSTPGTADGVTLSVYAGVLLARNLIDSGHRVGVAGLGVEGNSAAALFDGPPVYVPPGDAGVHAARLAQVCDLIAEHSNRSTPQPVPSVVDQLDQLLPHGSQLIVLSPLVDDAISQCALDLRRRGYEMTVLSPNLTGGAGTGARLERFDRASRMIGIRRVGVPVVDWDPNERLHLTIERMRRSGVLVS